MAVPTEYIFRIEEPYEIDAEDDQEISGGKAAKTRWGDGYKGFKSKIKEHLKLKQSGRCAFCRCWIGTGTSFSNLEHIVNKADYPKFEFLSKNLVYCCVRCNFGKSTRKTLSRPHSDKSRQRYPRASSGFIIVNPYFDNYEDHIDFIDNVIVYANNGSTKGKKTIEYYNLTRVELAEDRAFEFKINSDSIRKQLMVKLLELNVEQDILNQANGILANLPNWTTE